jgi:hypothetical protein
MTPLMTRVVNSYHFERVFVECRDDISNWLLGVPSALYHLIPHKPVFLSGVTMQHTLVVNLDR